MVRIGDRNNDGRLDESEFLQYCTDQERKLWTVFHYVDANKDGNILHYTLYMYMYMYIHVGKKNSCPKIPANFADLEKLI